MSTYQKQMEQRLAELLAAIEPLDIVFDDSTERV